MLKSFLTIKILISVDLLRKQHIRKIISNQGYNAKKVISEVYTHLLYCSVLSPGGNVNTRRMSKPDMRSIFHIKNQWNILVIGNYNVNYHNFQNSMLLSSDSKRTLIYLFDLFTNFAQRELVSMNAPSICNLCNCY